MTTSKPEAKEKIKKLVEKYEHIKKTRQVRKYDEANTRKDFIMPLFQALGWDVYNDFTDREVVEEETAIKGKVDYSFRINNIPQFLLEAKALKVDLDRLEWAKQAVTYGWNKGIPWVVLTNFEKLKLLSSDWLKEKPQPNLEFECDEFLDRFDDLWLLSKESIEKGELDKQTEKWGIKARRLKVSEKLASDLLRWRELLRKYFTAYNPKVNETEIDEAVQRVLDRLIFIRVCEDRKLEPPRLWETLQKWIANKRKPDNFMQALKPIFKDFDKKYNSNLFLGHLCEKLDTEGSPFEDIINDLYADKEEGVKYDFSVISADVLGAIYEQYLGFVQAKGLVKGSKRKKQGIYYTPSYIVDYIVQNTLGVALKEKSLREVENIKILDPACGSGSFLIRAFEVLDGHLKEEKAQKNAGPAFNALRKFNILNKNIYGVDLDSQAIEIARLNLLLKALEPNHTLPLLNNIKVGNSLISGAEKELKKYFGENWKEKKPFNWEQEFPEVFEDKGFDVVIGNPPYVSFGLRGLARAGRDLDKYLREKFPHSAEYKLSTYVIFLNRGVEKLKNGGYLGFIVPDSFLLGRYFSKLRKYILDTCKIKEIILFREDFWTGGVVGLPVIIILQKESDKTVRDENELTAKTVTSVEEFLGNKITAFSYKQGLFRAIKHNRFRLFFDRKSFGLVKKMESDSIRLGDVVSIHTGVRSKIGQEKIVSKRKHGIQWKKGIISGSEIGRYFLNYAGNYLNIDPKILWSGGFNPKIVLKDKLIMRQTGDSLYVTYDAKHYYHLNNCHSVAPKDKKYNLKFILALLNSKPMNHYYHLITLEKGRTLAQTDIETLEELPIRKIDLSNKTEESKHDKFVRLANTMLKLNKDLQKCAKDSDKYRAAQLEIEKVDEQIDQLVYRLYNLTPEEIKIVEESLD